MNPYVILMWALIPIAAITFVVCLNILDALNADASTGRTIKVAVVAAILVTLFAVIALPQLANHWDCENGTHPGERPCEERPRG